MSISRLNFDEISEADLQALIDTGTPEGIAIEYKRDSYGGSDADKKELLKDMSSFANTSGGHIIIGMDAEDGVPVEIAAIMDRSPDKEILRLENVIRDGVTPRITGVRIKALATGSGFAIVLRIPRSWNPPHQVSAYKTNRFYVRNSAGAHEVSVEELRMLFNLGVVAQERSRALREERRAKIAAGHGPVVLRDGEGKIIVHIIPLSAFSTRDQIDLREAYQISLLLAPAAGAGTTPRFNFDGLVNIAYNGQDIQGYSQVFRNGCIESVHARATKRWDSRTWIPSITFCNHVLDVVPRHLDALQALEVSPPFVVMITVEGVYGAFLGIDPSPSLEEAQPIKQASLELPEILIDDYSTKQAYQQALWNAGGFPEYGHYDSSRKWVRGHAPMNR